MNIYIEPYIFISLWIFAVCAAAIIDFFIIQNTFHWFRIIMWLFGPFTIVYLIIDFCNAVSAMADQLDDDERDDEKELRVVFWNKDKSSYFTIELEDVENIMECLANKMQNFKQININDCIKQDSNTNFIITQEYDTMIEWLKEMEEKLFTIHMLEKDKGCWIVNVASEEEMMNRRNIAGVDSKEYEQRIRDYFGIKDNNNLKKEND